MYAPRGLAQSELGKFDVVAAADALHLFSFPLPNHDIVVHAASDDGLAWRALPNAFASGDPGDLDDDEIWSVAVTERAGRYVMLYTGLARAEDGLVQRTLLATSPDLVRWTKQPRTPAAEADARWYSVGPRPDGRVSWRDAKPVWVGDTCFATLCAHEKDGPLLRRGCVGLLASRDLVSWQVRPPLFAPRLAWDLECPQLVQIDRTWYLTASISEDRTQRYWSAPAWDGPFAVPPGGGQLAPASHYAARIVRWRELDLLYAQVSCDYERPGFARRAGKFISPPLVLARQADGSLRCQSFPGWDAYRAASAPPSHQPATAFHGAPAETWRVDAPSGLDVLATAEPVGDVCLDGLLDLDAAAGGLVVRLGERGDGIFIALAPGSTHARLERWGASAPRASDRPFRFATLQDARLRQPIERGRPLPFRLLSVGHYLECSLDGSVVLTAFLPDQAIGRIGIWAEGGAVAASAPRLSPMRQPAHG